MSGSDPSPDTAAPAALARPPVVILVNPQLPENIGACARAMLNCGLTELRLVAPVCGWPHPKASAMASGADVVLEGARVFPTLAAAVADLQSLFATTARPRGMAKPVLSARAAAETMRELYAAGETSGLVFGPERTGLENDDVALADWAVQVPLNPAFSSLNLAQAVLILAYEWFQAGGAKPESEMMGTRRRRSPLAGKQDLLALFEHLESELERTGFLYPLDKRPRMIRNIRTMFLRANLTEQEVRTLRGMIKTLAHPRPNRGGEE